MKERILNRGRRSTTATLALVGITIAGCQTESSPTPARSNYSVRSEAHGKPQAELAVIRADLGRLAVKGRAPMTGYSREQFGSGWAEHDGCDTREVILRRDLTNKHLDPTGCEVLTGTLHDPYTGKLIHFTRGIRTSGAVQIDHMVALGDAWQTGAQKLSMIRRIQLANDPLELEAVDGSANEQKGDADAASWLPPNKAYRCTYVARQILVKQKYDLWVTSAEDVAMEHVLDNCSGQTITIPPELP